MITSVVVFLLLVLIALPGLLAGSRASGERNASSSLKTLTSAEADFRGNDRDDNKVNDFWVGDVSALYFMEARGEKIKLIELSVANADGAPLKPIDAPSVKAGYKFIAMKTDETGAPYDRGGGRNPGKFAFCAYPAEYKPKTWYRSRLDTATLTFIVNEENWIWTQDNGGKPVTRWPKDPRAEGWRKMD